MDNLKVKTVGPDLLMDHEDNMVDVSKTAFENGNKKVFTVPDSPFWRSFIVDGRLVQVQKVQRQRKNAIEIVEETPDEE